MSQDDPQVVIVGCGPVGLTLAIDLGQLGVRCLIVDKRDAPGILPKMERCNARTMEMYRRLGIAQPIRDLGFGPEVSMDVFIVTSLTETPLVHHHYPSVAEWRAKIAVTQDGSEPLEPYQLVSQYALEPFLRSVAESIPNVTVRFGCAFASFEQDAAGVSVVLHPAGGGAETVRAAYLVGCDGGGSTVREQIGARLEGESALTLCQALFRAPDLFERIPIGQGRHYHVADPEGSFLVMQGDTTHVSLHAVVDDPSVMPALFERVVNMPVEYELLYAGNWTQRLMVADRFRDRRVLIAGDAAHLVIPTGGLGMNTGVGDAVDLGWKLAGTLAGWGGAGLLDSYEAERRPIAFRNVAASRNATVGRRRWRALIRPGQDNLAEIAAVADVEQRKSNDLLGIEMGYRYQHSPILTSEPGGPDPDSYVYAPTTWPGARLPHVWRGDGNALQDGLGRGYTLLRLGEAAGDPASLAEAFAGTGAPFAVLALPEPGIAEVFGRGWLLVRPDLHIVWRGTGTPPAELARLATGKGK